MTPPTTNGSLRGRVRVTIDNRRNRAILLAVLAALMVMGAVIDSMPLIVTPAAVLALLVTVDVYRVLSIARGLKSRVKALSNPQQLRAIEKRLGRLEERQLRESALHDQSREIEALFQLFTSGFDQTPMPSSGRWAMDPRALLELRHLVSVHEPQSVVELGPGTSSVWLGKALVGIPGTLTGVDHDQQFLNLTQHLVEEHRLSDTIRLVHAPLSPITLGGREQPWYSLDALGDVTSIDLLIVDGPPGATCPESRWPALAALKDRLSPGAIIFVDDSDRPDEESTIADWLATYDELRLVPSLVSGGHTVLVWQGGNERSTS